MKSIVEKCCEREEHRGRIEERSCHVHHHQQHQVKINLKKYTTKFI
jgi:hypothetical protein